ncbi:MAG: Gmad2 immunoglobulin-like domain-containing protein [Anaerolineales bacterium]
MKPSRVLSLFIVLLLASFACNLPGPVTRTVGSPAGETPPDATQTPSIEPAIAVPPLTAEMLRNGTYVLPESKETVTLVDGKYDRAESMENILHVELRDPIAFGDLNGDGAEDAAIVLSENMGGTGFFMSVVAILNSGGAPLQGPSRFLDDRAQLNGLVITGGRIAVDAVIHGFEDPMCCPNFPVVQTLQLRGDRLILRRFVSETPGGDERSITITGPADGDSASGSFQLSGTVTISPFENNLAYKIYDPAGNELKAGSFLVTSGGMGTPGTFNVAIDLAGIPLGTVARLEISDLSAADGSLLAMDSVELMVK